MLHFQYFFQIHSISMASSWGKGLTQCENESFRIEDSVSFSLRKGHF